MSEQFDIGRISKEIADEMNKTKKWIATRTAKKMRNKLIKVYDSIIDQFYSYETKKYIRHGLSSVGTGDGVNLYKAMESHSGEPPRLQPSPHSVDGGIAISSNDMDGQNYKVSKDAVLDYVLNQGIRFPATVKFTKNGLKEFAAISFTANYSDSECSATGTPIEVLESIRDQLASKYADQAKEEAKRELKLKYIDIS